MRAVGAVQRHRGAAGHGPPGPSRTFPTPLQTEAVSFAVPLVDMANHDPLAPAAAFGLGPGGGAFRLTALRSLVPGDEVTISYTGAPPAPKPSDALLRDYGFVAPGNAADRLWPLVAGGGVGGAGGGRGSPPAHPGRAAAPDPASLAAAEAAADVATATGRRTLAAVASLRAVLKEGGGGGSPPPATPVFSLSTLADQAAAEEEEAGRRAATCAACPADATPSRAAAAAAWWRERSLLAAEVRRLAKG